VERLIFLSPIAGLAAGVLGSGTVIVLYMLKLRRRPVAVSSTLLWSRAVKDMEGNIPWQRLSPTLLLWVHLLIVVLLAMAIARPVFDDAMGDGQRVYLLIDSSASMNAVVDGKSGLERSKAQAIDRIGLLFDSGRSPSVSVVESALSPRIVIADSSERGRLIGAIQGIEPTDQPGAIHDAIAMIETLLEAAEDNSSQDEEESVGARQPASIWVYTDGGSVSGDQLAMRGGAGVSISPYPKETSLGNLGVVAMGASRDRSDPAMCRVFVRVHRNPDAPSAAVLRVFDGDTPIESRAISFEDGVDSVSETFELRLMQGVLLRVELDVDDALDDDDRAWVSVPDPSPVRITVVAKDALADPLLVDVLGVISRGEVEVVDGVSPIVDADLVVYDGVSPEGLADVATIGFASLLPDQDRADRLETLGRQTRMISWDRADPIVHDAGLGLVSYQRGVRLPEGSDGGGLRVLARDGDGPIIIERVAGAHRHLRVGFALHDSNWAVQVGLPIFLVNAVEELLPGTGGVGEVYSTSEVINLEDEGGSRASIGPIQRAGVIEEDGRRIGVAVLDAGESALNLRDPVLIGSGSNADASRLGGARERDLWRWFTLAAIVLIGLEWFMYAGRVRIS